MKSAPSYSVVFATAGLMLVAGIAPAQQVDIKEWPVPIRMDADRQLFDAFPAGGRDGTRPRDPYVPPDGRVFFCGQTGNYLAALDPKTGKFQRFALPEGAHPHNLIIDGNGTVWYAGNLDSHIGKLDPKTGQVTKIMMPDPEVRDPHTLVWSKSGDIWFTAQQSNAVGKLTVATSKVELIKVPTPRARPYGIVMDPTGTRPWIVLFGTNKLATVDPATMQLTEIEIPRAEARPRRLEVTSDGMVWYGDYAAGMLGRYDPTSGQFKEWPMPNGQGSRPYAMVKDDRDRLWIFEGPQGVPVNLVGFDTKAERVFSQTPLNSGPGTVRHAYYHAPTREIWFGADANTVGRAVVPR